ncbi:osmolarity sensor protein [compost metagenome]
MGADELQQAGVRFRRGRASKDRIGTGLGLAIAFEAVKASGGRLELTNRDAPQGLLVRLVIPLAIES